MKFYGRGGEIRTPDPLVPNQMRYQAALHSDGNGCIAGRAAMQASCLTAERKTQARPRPDPVGLHAATFQLEHIFRRTRR